MNLTKALDKVASKRAEETVATVDIVYFGGYYMLKYHIKYYLSRILPSLISSSLFYQVKNKKWLFTGVAQSRSFAKFSSKCLSGEGWMFDRRHESFPENFIKYAEQLLYRKRLIVTISTKFQEK